MILSEPAKRRIRSRFGGVFFDFCLFFFFAELSLLTRESEDRRRVGRERPPLLPPSFAPGNPPAPFLPISFYQRQRLPPPAVLLHPSPLSQFIPTQIVIPVTTKALL